MELPRSSKPRGQSRADRHWAGTLSGRGTAVRRFLMVMLVGSGWRDQPRLRLGVGGQPERHHVRQDGDLPVHNTGSQSLEERVMVRSRNSCHATRPGRRSIVLLAMVVATTLAGFPAPPATAQTSSGADVSLSIADTPDPVLPGGTIEYALTVTNSGPDAASGVRTQAAIPQYTLFDSSTECTLANGVVCEFGELPVGGSATRRFKVRVNQNASDGQVINLSAAATTTTIDPSSANNSGTETTVVSFARGDVSLSIADTPDPVLPGGTIEYALTVTNSGPDAASGVRTQAAIPQYTLFDSSTECTLANGVVCEFGELPVGGSATRRFKVRVNQNASDGQVINLSAAATTTTIDPSSANNSDTETTTVTRPPNRPPVADAGADQGTTEGTTVTLDGSASSDPDGDLITHTWTQTAGPPVTLAGPTTAAPSFTAADNGAYEFELTVSDGTASATNRVAVTVANVAPTVGKVTGPTEPVAIGTTVSVSAPFSDAGSGDTHTGTINWGDGTTSAATISNGTAGAGHSYGAPGVYRVIVSVTDDDGASGSAVFDYVVVYDPSGGFVTGGGWINSPAGSYLADPQLTGRATFGFVSRYDKGRTVPTGDTHFQFSAAGFSFGSTRYEWLVVSGGRAQVRGFGKVNGAGDYSFTLTARDGSPDTFRIKIVDRTSGEVVYDNQQGASDTAEPVTALGGGSIVIHKVK